MFAKKKSKSKSKHFEFSFISQTYSSLIVIFCLQYYLSFFVYIFPNLEFATLLRNKNQTTFQKLPIANITDLANYLSARKLLI